jgi:SAM-dependent methyltransferase
MESDTYHLMRRLEDGHWWFVARRKIIESLLASMEIPRPAEILEVGCGTGGNISMLNNFGKVTGVEQDDAAAQMARDRDLAQILSGELPEGLPVFARKFDLINLFDVIEHVKEDGASLRALSALLNPGGRIVLTVPAFPFLWSQHYDDSHHQRRYRRRDLKDLSRKHGLSLDYASYFNFWLFPPVALIRLIRKVIPYRESWSDMRQPGKWINRMLLAIFSSERHIIGKGALPFGISLIAVMSAPPHQRPNGLN